MKRGKMSGFVDFDGSLAEFMLGSKSYIYDIENQIDLYHLFLAAFRSEDVLREFLVESSSRQGVQLVYGDRGLFTHFLSAANAAGHFDQDLYDSVSTPMPLEIIKAIIPLGEYEQSRWVFFHRNEVPCIWHFLKNLRHGRWNSFPGDKVPQFKLLSVEKKENEEVVMRYKKT